MNEQEIIGWLESDVIDDEEEISIWAVQAVPDILRELIGLRELLFDVTLHILDVYADPDDPCYDIALVKKLNEGLSKLLEIGDKDG